MISYFEDQLKAISDAIHTLNEGEFRRLVMTVTQAVKSGHKVVVSGLGKNVPICDKFVGSMVSMGLDACFLHTNSAIHGDMGVVKDGDVVIMLSKSGNTSESIYLERLLKERDVNMWLISFEEESVLAREIENKIIMRLEHEGDMWNIMPNNSTTLTLMVLQGVAMMVAKELNLPLDDFKRNHPGGNIGKLLGGNG